MLILIFWWYYNELIMIQPFINMVHFHHLHLHLFPHQYFQLVSLFQVSKVKTISSPNFKWKSIFNFICIYSYWQIISQHFWWSTWCTKKKKWISGTEYDSSVNSNLSFYVETDILTLSWSSYFETFFFHILIEIRITTSKKKLDI